MLRSDSIVLTLVATLAFASPSFGVLATFSFEGDVMPSDATPAWGGTGQPNGVFTLGVEDGTYFLRFDPEHQGVAAPPHHVSASMILPTNISGTHTLELRARVNEAGDAGGPNAGWVIINSSAAPNEGYELATQGGSIRLDTLSRNEASFDWNDGQWHVYRLYWGIPAVGNPSFSLHVDGNTAALFGDSVSTPTGDNTLLIKPMGGLGGQFDVDYLRVVNEHVPISDVILPTPSTLCFLSLVVTGVLARRQMRLRWLFPVGSYV